MGRASILKIAFFKKGMFARKSFTLIELLIAIVLLAPIILAATSVDIASRRFFAAIREQTHAQDEVKIAMEHMVKNFVQTHEIYDFGLVSTCDDFYTIGVRLDPNSTPGDINDDIWIVYRYVATAAPLGEIWYYPDAASAPGTPPPPLGACWGSWMNHDALGNYEVIATEIFVDGTSPAMFTVPDDDNQIDIDITAQDEDSSANLQTSVILRSMPAT